MTEYVWEFTNKRKLSKSEFLSYVERKVFRTIRQYGMLPSDKVIRLVESEVLNTVVLRSILSSKFEVVFSSSPNMSDENRSDVAEKVFSNALQGLFSGPRITDLPFRPLYKVSDEELSLYAKLKGLSSSLRDRSGDVQSLFSHFKSKNPDLELNVLRALSQVPESFFEGSESL